MERTEIPCIDPDPKVGLTPEQVRLRTEGGWSNRTGKVRLPSEKQIILHHVCTFFNLVFAILALILVLVRSSVTNFGFLGVVVINLVIGIVQQIRAKRALEKLTLVSRQTVKTVRGGNFEEIPSDELVIDDIVMFAAGNQICADCVLREGSLQVNESLITGEGDPVEKQPGDELMSGSFVVSGAARAQLIRVGDDSYAARLSNEAKRDPKAAKGQMMRALDTLIRVLGALLLPLGMLYFISAMAQPAAAPQAAAEQTVAAMVSLIPQGLYLVTSVAMAASSIKLSRKKVLAQDMNCIEPLARVDVLCVDKTSTITEAAMEVEELIPLSGAPAEYLEQVLGNLYGTQYPENETARALAEQYGGATGWTCLHRIPFTSRHKWSGAVFEKHGAFLTGAPDIVMGSRYGELADSVSAWSGRGRRVLLMAAYEGTLTTEPDIDRITPLALIVLTSRIREEAPNTFRFFKKQGVAVKVISGDDPVTVSRVALRAGIEGAEHFVDCTRLTAEQLQEAAERCTVFGRVTPEQKRELVKALQKNHTVAMTGDGVNDVLAMRQADCAVAIAGGAQAAVQVAQLVLVNGDFAGIPRIFNEGRRVINNIGRAAALFLVKNIFTLALVLTALFSPLIYPFQPVHLTVVMALTVGIPSFFFALEPNFERVTGSFLSNALCKALPGGLAAFAAVAAAQLIAPHWGIDGSRLSTVCAIALAAVGMAVLIRISRPLTKLRVAVIITMAVLLVGAFLLPVDLLGMDIWHLPTAILAVLASTVAIALLCLVQWLAHRLGKKG